MAKWLKHQRPRKLIHPNEAPLKESERSFPPQKKHIGFNEWRRTVATEKSWSLPAWFEDANHFYYVDYGVDGSRLVLAQEKDVYFRPLTVGEVLEKPGSAAIFRPGTEKYHQKCFNFLDARFDARFIFGQDALGTIMFGNYHDGNLGRIFRLTEPKDAREMLICFQTPRDSMEWLDDTRTVKYLYHDPECCHLFIVAPVGARFLEDKQIAIVYQNKSISDRELYQGLFNELLKEFVGFKVKKTEFKVETPPPSPEEIAEKAQLEAKSAARREKIAQAIIETKALLQDRLKDALMEFGLEIDLNSGDELRKIGDREVVYFRLLPAGNIEDHIFYYSVDSETFALLSPEANADDIEAAAIHFLDEHSEKFRAFKRIFDANLSYHNLVNTNSPTPKLDYKFIFGSGLY